MKSFLSLLLLTTAFAVESDSFAEAPAQHPTAPSQEVSQEPIPIPLLAEKRKIFPYASVGSILIFPTGSVGMRYFFKENTSFDFHGGMTVDIHGQPIYFGGLDFQHYFSKNAIMKPYVGGGLMICYAKYLYASSGRFKRYVPLPKVSVGLQLFNPLTQNPHLFVALSTSVYILPQLDIGYLF